MRTRLVAPVVALCSMLLAQASLAQAPTGSAGRATLRGVVVDSAGRPLPDATVQVQNGGVSTRTSADGSFSLEQVPAPRASVEVLRPGYRVLAFDVDIAAGVTVSVRLTLQRSATAAPDAEPAPAAPTVSGRSSVLGTVIDSAGQPVSGAMAEIVSLRLSVLTDADGRFRLDNVPPGVQVLRVRRVGFRPDYVTLTLRAGAVSQVVRQLRPAVAQLARVEVRDRRNADILRGFEERRRKLDGIFVDREEIQRRNASQVTDVLRGRTGINVLRDQSGNMVVFGRRLNMTGYCPAGVVVDGVVMSIASNTGVSVDQFVNVQDIRAIEVYKSGPSVPAEFQREDTNCGAVVVWTNR